MALPRAEELSRWTVNQVTTWLTQSSLAAFRDDFLGEGIDGSKLMNLAPEEVDQKYKHIKKNKREVLKDHLRSIKAHRTPPTWSAPVLPPRPGGGGNKVPQDEEQQDSDGGWDTDFEDSDPEEYLEPTTGPQQLPSRPGPNREPQPRPPPPLPPEPETQSEYEIADEEETVRAVRDLRRKPSIVDQLRNELATRKSTDDEKPVRPPPRPPRGNPVEHPVPSSKLAGHPQHMTRGNATPPEDVYEVMNDSTDQGPGKVHVDPPTPHKRELPKPTPEPERLPPKPKVAQQPALPGPQGGFLFNDPQAAGTVIPPTKNDDLSGYAWYHGKISRASATTIFEREQKDGMFLIRKSEREPNQPYTLVIWQSGRIWNIPIRKLSNNMYAAGKFKQGETQFSSIVELVEHFKVVSLSLKSAADQAEGTNKLTIPAPKY